MWVSERHLKFLEAELADWKARYAALEAGNRALVDSIFAVQGAPAPYQGRRDNELVVAGRKTWDQWKDELEAETAVVTEQAIGN